MSKETWEDRRIESVLWSRRMLTDRDFIILDTETTGIHTTAETVSISILSGHGLVLFDALVNPHSTIPSEATRVHHIEDKHMMLALDFEDVHRCLEKLLYQRHVVIYNVAFDVRILSYMCKKYKLPAFDPLEYHDAMIWYSQWIGEWSDYREDYKWQRLPGGDYTSIGDCKATLEVIERMANDYLPGEDKKPEEEQIACQAINRHNKLPCAEWAKYKETTSTWPHKHIYKCANHHETTIEAQAVFNDVNKNQEEQQ